jgi:UDP-N-acetylglucosamine diphosphorylase/glucosamine-1-phosphate N-acetyltransferase
MKIQLHDNGLHLRFAPLTLTRPIGNLRIGILTNDERWKLIEPSAEVFYQTEAYLEGKFPAIEDADLIINAAVIPNEESAVAILNLAENEQLWMGKEWFAKRGTGEIKVEYIGEKPVVISERWHIYQKNGEAILSDFNLITAGRQSLSLSKTNTLIGDESIVFIEEGASVEAAILNTTSGPIYIGKGAEIMEGSIIRGPLAMCEHSALKLGAKVYGPTTLGPNCKVGGEVNNVVFQAFSNKGHDGFLGNAIIGEWCNLGADTNTSNLKNNYGNISTYSYEHNAEIKTDIQFMGVCMGDHSKCGINTMFNTATVVGVSSNIYGAGFPDKYIPSFSWGGADEIVPFRFEKALEFSNNMMSRRGLKLTQQEIEILKYIADHKL